MWIASKYGFYSIVKKEGHFHVRARTKKDLVDLLATAELDFPVEIWPAADYRFRFRIPEKDLDSLSVIFGTLMDSIDYTNFKSEIAATPGQRKKLPAYHEIWHTMAREQI
jgi:hypothetical protein